MEPTSAPVREGRARRERFVGADFICWTLPLLKSYKVNTSAQRERGERRGGEVAEVTTWE